MSTRKHKAPLFVGVYTAVKTLNLIGKKDWQTHSGHNGSADSIKYRRSRQTSDDAERWRNHLYKCDSLSAHHLTEILENINSVPRRSSIGSLCKSFSSSNSVKCDGFGYRSEGDYQTHQIPHFYRLEFNKVNHPVSIKISDISTVPKHAPAQSPKMNAFSVRRSR